MRSRLARTKIPSAEAVTVPSQAISPEMYSFRPSPPDGQARRVISVSRGVGRWYTTFSVPGVAALAVDHVDDAQQLVEHHGDDPAVDHPRRAGEDRRQVHPPVDLDALDQNSAGGEARVQPSR